MHILRTHRNSVLLMLVMVVANLLTQHAFAQAPADGIYFIDHQQGGFNYMGTRSPATGAQARIFFTIDSSCYWQLTSVTYEGLPYYTIYNLNAGKYLSHREGQTGNASEELRDVITPSTAQYYQLEQNGTLYRIIPYERRLATGNVALNPYGYNGGTSATVYTIGLYTRDNANSQWYLLPAPALQPTAQREIEGPTIVQETGVYNFSTNSKINFIDTTNGNIQVYEVEGETRWYASGLLPGMSFDASTATLTVSSMPTTYASINITCEKRMDGNVVNSTTITVKFPLSITSLAQITDINGIYKLTADIDASSDASPLSEFRGNLDGQFHTISSASRPLFTVINDAVICNLALKEVTTSGTANVGAIAGQAFGATRIYNCSIQSGTVSGGDTVGGLVGSLHGQSRIVNCYSFANVSGITYAGGIVGYNDYASTSSDLRTLVMNCMFYGNILSGTYPSPIYGGELITNVYTDATNTGINNFNYFLLSVEMPSNVVYNAAGAAEKRFLTRFEFYRLILNSNRDLCKYYLFNGISSTGEMAKWVLDTNVAPYPILKPQGRYPSVINAHLLNPNQTATPITPPYSTDPPASTYQAVIDYNDPTARATGQTTRYVGGCLGTLTVTVLGGSDNGLLDRQLTLTLHITDMDTAHADFAFRKVQLPYYNELFGVSTNYGAKVCTGWDIIAVTGNSNNTFSTTTYNFADTTDIGKDLFETSGRVFAQGGFYYVPQGVSAITLRTHWANAYYASDRYYDVTTGLNATTHISTELYNFTIAGARPTTFKGYPVYNSWQSAVTAMNSTIANATVYDNALVLVGNLHRRGGDKDNMRWNNDVPYTIMSADLDGDCEPDYYLCYQAKDRTALNPIRFDFLNFLGLGMKAKTYGAINSGNTPILTSAGHFEVTETCVVQFTEFEYECDRYDKTPAPVILNGGLYVQFVAARDKDVTRTTYILLGGHAWFKAFANGPHSDKNKTVNHCPISVLGGDYDEFYLTGIYNPAAPSANDDAWCYVNGGRFGVLAGAGQEQLLGDVHFRINHAVIDEFYGGGLNAKKPVNGNIDIEINNTLIRNKYCAGPKFGAMAADKTVSTRASCSVFAQYFGAGNGGTSLYRNKQTEKNDGNGADYTWFSQNYRYTRGGYTDGQGIQTSYEFEYFTYAGGYDKVLVGRFFVNYASFDLATVNQATSQLERCVMLGDFHGAGYLGSVSGDVSSTLTDCTVFGSVYGGGYSVTVPTVEVYPQSRATQSPQWPDYNSEIGVFVMPQLPPTDAESYTWSNEGTNASPWGTGTIHTDVPLVGLGAVNGNTSITINGNQQVGGHQLSHIYGSVYGGGNASDVCTNGGKQTTVTIDGHTQVDENVFGGGRNGKVGTIALPNNETRVYIKGASVIGKNVYGGGNAGEVNGSTNVFVGQ